MSFDFSALFLPSRRCGVVQLVFRVGGASENASPIWEFVVRQKRTSLLNRTSIDPRRFFGTTSPQVGSGIDEQNFLHFFTTKQTLNKPTKNYSENI